MSTTEVSALGEYASVLVASPALSGLGPDEVAAVERAAEVVECEPGEHPCRLADEDRRLFFLIDGQLMARVSMQPGRRCGGEAEITLDRPGDVLGWTLLMRQERLMATARCVTPARLLAVDLAWLPARTRLSLAKRLALHLYGQLKWLGLCRPDTGLLLGLAQTGIEWEMASPGGLKGALDSLLFDRVAG